MLYMAHDARYFLAIYDLSSQLRIDLVLMLGTHKSFI